MTRKTTMDVPIRDWMRFGRQTAEALGAPWRAERSIFDQAVLLAHPDGCRVLVSCDRTDTRVAARGELPPKADRVRTRDHQISVRADRGPAVLAAEITRRLLPDYRKDLAAAQEHLREQDRMLQARTDRVRRLSASLTGESRVPSHLATEDWTTICWYWRQPGSHTIRLLGDGSRAELRLSALPYALVQQICDLIAQYDRTAGGQTAGRRAL